MNEDIFSIILESFYQDLDEVYKKAGKPIDNLRKLIRDFIDLDVNSLVSKSKEITMKIDKINQANKNNVEALESIFNYFRKDNDKNNPIYFNLGKQDYINIVNDLESNLEKVLKVRDCNNLLQFLETNLSKIPCKSSASNKDITFYNNIKLTSSIASCIKTYLEDNRDLNKEINNSNVSTVVADIKKDTDIYLLVSADISGIQNFIYTISSKGALKSLRGRSFYLEILLENIIDEILQELNLSRANLLYSGGGHFYMLLPNTEKAKSIIEKVKNDINDWFINIYRTNLYIEISYIEASENDLSNKDIKINSLGNLYKNVGQKNSIGKIRRYNKEQLSRLMFNSSNKEQAKECTICTISSELDEVGVCKTCNNLISLGDSLPRLNKGDNVLVITNKESSRSLALPSIINKQVYLSSESYKDIDKRNENYIRGYSINKKLDFDNKFINIFVGTYSKMGLNHNLITFEELANKSMGINRIGVLRADVDNLGQAFINGFELKNDKEKFKYISLSRNSMLSYTLSKFFKFDINDICKGREEGFKLLKQESKDTERNVVIVYAGGDDLFIVGAWNEVLELAVDINDEFLKFSNNKMSISAGLGIFNSSYPINQMANKTGALEHISKITGKNKITLFDDSEIHSYEWNDFKNSVCRNKMDKILTWFTLTQEDSDTEDNKMYLSKAKIYKLINLIRELKKDKKINLARIAYELARMQPSKKELKESYNEFINNFYDWILNKNDLKELETALTLIIYLYREDDK